MRYRRAFTLLDLIVLVFVLGFVGWGIFAPSRCGARQIANRSVCAANLTGIYKSMYTYNVTSSSKFPYASRPREDRVCVGFREGNRLTGAGAMLDQNITASLWVLVRDGSNGTGQFICPTSGDVQDRLTVSATNAAPAALAATRDFLEPSNLSYSSINMYHNDAGRLWGSNASASYILMGDSNSNDSPGADEASPGRHRQRFGEGRLIDTDDAEYFENSGNHHFSGQNLLFGDSHVSFVNDPFVGEGDDNPYSMGPADAPAPPSLANDAPLASPYTDSVLIPLTGNGGVSLSGLPGTVGVDDDGIHSRTMQRNVAAFFAVIAVIVSLKILKPRWLTTPLGQRGTKYERL